MLPTYIGAMLSLITFPLIASRLGVSGFGQLDLFLLFGVILSFSLQIGWGSAHNRYYFEEDISGINLVRTLMWFRIFISIIIIFLTWLLQKNLLQWLGVSEDAVVMIWTVVGTFICTDFSEFHLLRYRMLGKGFCYMVMALSRSLLYALSLLVVLYFFALTPARVLACSLFSVALPLFVAWILDHDWMFNARFEWSILKRTLCFGAPLVVAGLAVLGLRTTDRAMLNSLIADPKWSLVLLGYYAFALRLVSISNLATGGFSVLWGPYVMKTYREVSAPLRYKYIYSTYLLIITVLNFCIIGGSVCFVPMFFPQYVPALPLVSILLASNLAYALGDYFCVGIGIKEKTWIRTVAGIGTVAVNIVLNFFLIRHFDAMGAAISTLVSTLFYTGFLMWTSHRLLYPVQYPFVTTIFIIFLTVATVLYSFISPFLLFVGLFFVVSLFIFILRKDVKGVYDIFYGS